jgi:hypothetical protein
MAMKLRRSGSVFGAGVLLLTVYGCAVDAAPEEQGAKLDTKTQALDPFCEGWCEDIYWDYSLSCESPDLPGRGGNSSCYQQAEMEMATCLDACGEPEWEEPPIYVPPPPPSICSTGIAANETPGECNEASLTACYRICDACSTPYEMGNCNQACLFEFCPTNCYEENWWVCVIGCNSSPDPVACTDRCFGQRCGPG